MKKGYQSPNEPQPKPVKRPIACFVWKVSDSIAEGIKMNEYGATHADMLRYDLCFCNPDSPEQVIFPVFKTAHGHTTRAITLERWRSFGMSLDRLRLGSAEDNIEKWVSYKSNGMSDLIDVTLGEYMEREKAKIVAWR